MKFCAVKERKKCAIFVMEIFRKIWNDHMAPARNRV